MYSHEETIVPTPVARRVLSNAAIRRVVTALKPVQAEQVRRPERKQNWTVPHCGSVLPICLSLRPVGPIGIIIETVLIIIILTKPRAAIR